VRRVLGLRQRAGKKERFMDQAINISIAGICGVLFGILLLFLTVKVTTWVTDRIEKKEETEKQ
jgi:hypothetical protein